MKRLRVTVNGKVFQVEVEVLDDDDHAIPVVRPHVSAPQAAVAAPVVPTAARPVSRAAEGGDLKAPIAGTVADIPVAVGDQVEQNQPLVVVDAMKMDTCVRSPRAGTVQSIHCQKGDRIEVGQLLMVLA